MSRQGNHPPLQNSIVPYLVEDYITSLPFLFRYSRSLDCGFRLKFVVHSGGISFGGVVSFIFADLITLPILDIYCKYYGWKFMGYLLVPSM